MVCLQSSRITEIQSTITNLQAALVIANASYLEALNPAQDYRVDTGEGSQRVKRRDPTGLLNSITSIQRQIDYWTRKLNGTGITRMNLRRKPAGGC